MNKEIIEKLKEVLVLVERLYKKKQTAAVLEIKFALSLAKKYLEDNEQRPKE